MFDIRFDSTEHETDDQLVVGTIVLGSHKETFEACLCLCSRHDNQLLFLESLDAALDPDSPFEHVSSYEPIDEDGRPVSEWTIGIEAIREFHNSRGLST